MKKIFLGLFIFIALVAAFLSIDIGFSTWNSNEFNATQTQVRLNWTNNYSANITVTVPAGSYRVLVALNDTTDSKPTPNYTQGGSGACANVPLKIYNGSGIYSNIIGTLGGSSTDITLIHTHLECYPGLYRTDKFTIANQTNTSENANVTVLIDIPIVVNNTLSQTTGVGSFPGNAGYNATTYQSYYFFLNNATSIENATAVTINASGWSGTEDLDIFLFDNSGVLRARSQNKTHASEELVYSFLPATPAVWEIRVYGNSSNSSGIPYTGYLIFSTLNITNTSSSGTSFTLINLGVLNASSTSINQNITLTNEGNLNLGNVNESKVMYHYQIIPNVSQTTNSLNYTFLVPTSDIAKSLKVVLNWTGQGNYSFELMNPYGRSISKSNRTSVFANMVGATYEEYNETTDIVPGYWTVNVTNWDGVKNYYNISIYTYLDPTGWITTNYTTTNFNSRYNSTRVNISFTIPGRSMNGIYGGYLQYRAATGAAIRLPIKINVTAATLVVNKTLNSSIVWVDENIGANLSKVINVTLNNTGAFTLPIIAQNLTVGLCHETYTTRCLNFTYNMTSSLPANYSGTMGISFFTDPNITQNTTGLYKGTIFLNASEAHPDQGFTLNVWLNLTNKLRVDVKQFVANGSSIPGNVFVNNTTAENNISMRINVYYINGTAEITNLNMRNFTSAWFEEKFVSQIDGAYNYGRIPNSGTLTIQNYSEGSDPYCAASCPDSLGGDGYYLVNATIPGNRPGGRYKVYATVNYTRSSDNLAFSGEGYNDTLTIVAPGLYMINDTTSVTIYNGTSYDLYVNVSNFGHVANSSATITASYSSCGFTVSPTYENCPSTSFAPSAYNTSCIVKFRLTYSSATSCTMRIVGAPNHNWFNRDHINVSVTTSLSTSSSSTTPAGTSNPSSTAATTTTTAVATTTTTAAVAVASEVKTIAKIAAGQSETITIDNSDTLKIQEISIKVKNEVTNVKITVKESSLPSGTIAVMTADKGEIYKYIEISKENIQNSDIDTVEIKFKVDNTWLSTNNIDESKLALYHYENDTWTKLSTTLVNKSDTYAFYKAQTSSLSLFAIAGEKAGLFSLDILGPYAWWIAIGIGAAAVIILAYLFWPTKGETKAEKPGSAYGARSETKLTTEPEKEKKEKSSLSDKFSALKEKWSKKDRAGYKGS